MTASIDNQDLVFLPLEEAVIPPPGHIEHLKDKWWSYVPEKGLILYRSRGVKTLKPQCNSSEEMCKRLTSQLYPWAEIKFVPSVFIKLYVEDWRE